MAELSTLSPLSTISPLSTLSHLSTLSPLSAPTARMSEGDGLDAFPTVVDQSVNMQWDLSEVLLGANSWIGFAACCGCLLCLPCGRISCVPTFRGRPYTEG